MKLGDIIHEYRITHDMSMADFSKKMGRSKAYVGVLEKGLHPTTGKPVTPSIKVIKQAAKAMNVDFNDLFKMLDGEVTLDDDIVLKPKHLPIYGRVAASFDRTMYRDIIGEIDDEEYDPDEYLALQISGDSMQPRIMDGDIVIVKYQPDVESSELAIITVNGEDATCKRIKKHRDGIELIANNPSYQNRFFSYEEVESLPVTIIGKVVELRARF